MGTSLAQAVQRGGAALVAGALAACLSGPAAALDLRVGQHWACRGDHETPDLTYTIVALVRADEIVPASADDRRIAFVAIAPEGGGAPLHAAVAVPVLGCLGQVYLREGVEISPEARAAFADWRSASPALVEVLEAPVDRAYADWARGQAGTTPRRVLQ